MCIIGQNLHVSGQNQGFKKCYLSPADIFRYDQNIMKEIVFSV